MISPSEACLYVQQELPDVSAGLTGRSDIYKTLYAFREYACRNASEHDYSRLQRCFTLATALYEKGESAVKGAIENIFVYSFSRLFALVAEDKRKVKALIPTTLLTLYMNQVLHRGY